MNKNYNEYKNLLINTFKYHHPKYLTLNLIKLMEKDDLVNNNKRKSLQRTAPLLAQLSDDIIDVSEIPDPGDKMEYILNNTDNLAYKYLERFEYLKSYKYAVVFNLINIDSSKVNTSIETGKLQIFKKEEYDFDIVLDDLTTPAATVAPSGNNMLIKFSFLLTPKNIDSQLGNIKYPVICDIDTETGAIEIRFDRVSQDYQSIRDFYTELIENVLICLRELMGIEVENIDFKAIIDYIRIKNDPDINIYAMDMRRNGGRASLDADSNEDFIIPILGELEDLINENDVLFKSNEETLKIKSKLKDFIDEILLTSDLPSVKIFWSEQDTKVGVKHDYKGKGYSLFIFYDNLIESKEKMDYVRNYFIEANRKLNQET